MVIYFSGGYYYVYVDFGSGFCLFNDLVIVVYFVFFLFSVDKVLIIDSDVYYGDGMVILCVECDEIIMFFFYCDKNFLVCKFVFSMDVGYVN